MATATALEGVLEATRPEDVFGELPEVKRAALRDAAEIWRRLSREIHPDRNSDPRATEAAATLNVLYDAATRAIKAGKYGTGATVVNAVTIATRRHAYKITDLVAQGDSCNVYAATYADDEGEKPGLVKIVRHPSAGDLVGNEAKTLKALLSDTTNDVDFAPYLPPYKEAFGYRAKGERKARQGIAFGPRMPNLYTLAQVRARYPDGVTAKDAAWMFRRLLMVVGFTQAVGYVHGAILPEHVLIEPDMHGLVLIDWKYSVESGQPMRAIPSGSREFYPAEVLAKKPVTTATDLFMAARCMAYVMGGDLATGAMPERMVPRQIRAFFKGTALPMQARRPQDAFELKNEYDELIVRMWGPRRFRPFSM